MNDIASITDISKNPSFIEKILYIKPEDRIGRTIYSMRIMCLWIINGIFIVNLQVIFAIILILTKSIFFAKLFLILIIGIITYISFIQIYKRITDYEGSKIVFWIMSTLAISAFMQNLLGNSNITSIAGIIGTYTILVSIFRSKEEKYITKTIEDGQYILSETDKGLLIIKGTREENASEKNTEAKIEIAPQNKISIFKGILIAINALIIGPIISIGISMFILIIIKYDISNMLSFMLIFLITYAYFITFYQKILSKKYIYHLISIIHGIIILLILHEIGKIVGKI